MGLVDFEFVDDDAYERGGLGINSLAEVLKCIFVSVKEFTHHKTQVAPVIEEVPVDIDAIRLAEVLGYQPPDGR